MPLSALRLKSYVKHYNIIQYLKLVSSPLAYLTVGLGCAMGQKIWGALDDCSNTTVAHFQGGPRPA